MTPQQRAERAAQEITSRDVAATSLGIELNSVQEGAASMGLTVEARHLNGHGICHGGITFTLADTAFAIACNSRNQNTVAQHNVITYLEAGALGDRLTAEAREVSLVGRTGIYDVTVTRQDGTVLAQFRGMSRTIAGQLFDE